MLSALHTGWSIASAYSSSELVARYAALVMLSSDVLTSHGATWVLLAFVELASRLSPRSMLVVIYGNMVPTLGLLLVPLMQADDLVMQRGFRLLRLWRGAHLYRKSGNYREELAFAINHHSSYLG